jgi:hypothetical protein
MKRIEIAIGVAAAFLLATVTATPATADRASFNNWHIHDGGSDVDANGLVHRPVGFFPGILTGGDLTTYLQDPAYCPDATDKLTLPAGSNGQFPIVGVCTTKTLVIHLRAIPAGGSAPTGYQSTGWTISGSVIYYALTAR